MTEYIERKALITALCKEIIGDGDYYNGKDDMQDEIRDMVSHFQAADVAPVRHEKWEVIVGSDGKEHMVCTGCRKQQDLTGVFTYCPNCGAKMDFGGLNMTHEEFKTCLEELDGQGAKTLAEKNARYSSSDDALHNFKMGAEIVGGTPAQACWGYMTKHLVALRDMIQRNDFHNREDVLEKIQDSINYLRFIWAISEEERNKYCDGCQSEAVKTLDGYGECYTLDGYGECYTCEHENKSEFEMPCVTCRNNCPLNSAKYTSSPLLWEPKNHDD